MKTAFLLLLPFSLLTGLTSLSAEEAPPQFREVRVHVLDLEGAPAANRSAYLRGLSRGSISPGGAPWIYSTDDSGRFTVRLLNSRTWDDPENRPGWGNYALVVNPQEGRDAGAVSPIFMNVGTSGNASYGGHRNAGDWGVPVHVPDEGIDLTLQITTGIVVEGTVWDYEAPTKPLVGAHVHVFQDLGAESHTGYGGEIFQQDATTDAEGRYRFEHVYPHRVLLNLGGPDTSSLYWLRTKIDQDSWVDEPVYGIPIQGWLETLQVEMAAATKPLFRYSGKVTDKTGKPVAGAEVTFSVSLHKDMETHFDSHNFESTTTDPGGKYEILLPTPWINGMSAKTSEENRVDHWDRRFAPGQYDFVLKP